MSTSTSYIWGVLIQMVLKLFFQGYFIMHPGRANLNASINALKIHHIIKFRVENLVLKRIL